MPAGALTVRVAGEAYALPAPAVREVLRPVPLTRVPHAPPGLLGLASLRGAVLPVLSLARLLGRDEPAPSPAARVVVAEDPPLGLLVEEVTRLGTGEGAHTIDLPALLARGFGAGHARPSAQVTARPVPSDAPGGSSGEAAEARVALLAFALADQDYALPLESVAGVARLPGRITALPGAEPAMLGAAPYRGGLLPLVSLRALLGLPAAAEAGSRLVVVRIGHLLVGLVVDALRTVLRPPQAALDPVPAVLTRGTGEVRVQAIARLDGDRLVSVLSPGALFDEETTARLLAASRPEAEGAAGLQAEAAERLVVFDLGKERFGLPLTAVEEVVRHPRHLARIPRAPDFVAGAMTLRGAALPVIDLRRRFGGAGTGDPGRVVVVGAEGLRAGLAVDAVSGVLPVADLLPAPEPAGTGAEVFDRVARVERDGRMILVLAPRALLEAAGRDLLAAAGEVDRAGGGAGPAP
ncbi:chemotaxis protein CheW [Roseomonas populi]|uniref:Chemotaxis protein CheW n=1 Tax=Roseomonas populi TaxID=3121582 RepID=A0ABT1X064_9PROT|nr:chemotaxis protein CheW [Roseomonas pecuniae]MCR0981492.1 chemotaxis protein CheW [Roseomonas pecuniae]